MVDTSMKLRYLSLFNAYPIVDDKPMPDLKMERAKMVIVAYIMERTHNQPAQFFLEKMCIVRETGVSRDFITDYGKVQYLYERYPVMRDLPEFLYRCI